MDLDIFRPRARILHTLGSELISSDKVALIELVKNSYDADAETCIIRYGRPTSEDHGVIEVLDDGHGMSLEELQRGWLELASINKTTVRLSEVKNRPLLGEKGVGRLASSRLGDHLQVVTQRANSELNHLSIDWRQFSDPSKFLDQIKVSSHSTPQNFATMATVESIRSLAESHSKYSSGTLLQITEAVPDWTRDDIADIYTSLQRLVAPSTEGTNQDFRIILLLPEDLSDYGGVVEPLKFSAEPLYFLRAITDAKGITKLTIGGSHPHIIPTTRTERIWPEGSDLRCGPVTIEFRIWDRDRDGIEIAAPSMGLRDFRRQLDSIAGVSIYRDGFRLFPYGERGDDWLSLDRRRVNAPTLRVSNNQIVGFVLLTGTQNPELVDQSNREGLIDNEAFEDLRELVLALLAALEAARRAARASVDADDPAPRPGGIFDEFDFADLQAEAREAGAGPEVLQAIEGKAERVGQALETVQGSLTQFRMHAAMGQLVDRVVHDGRNCVGPIRNKAELYQATLGPEDQTLETPEAKARRTLLNTIEIQTKILVSLFDGLDPLSGRRLGRPSNVSSIRAVRDGAFARDSSLCPNAWVHVEGEAFTVRWAESDIIVAVMNLINNALYWLSVARIENPEVCITVSRSSDSEVRIRVSDNGPGVPPELSEHVFDSYFSRKPNGVGLGLAIVGSVAAAYAGRVELLPEGELGGATFDLIIGSHI